MNEPPKDLPADCITISVKEYNGLTRSRDWLRCLESAGIDNSEAYEFACELWRKNHPNEDPDE